MPFTENDRSPGVVLARELEGDDDALNAADIASFPLPGQLQARWPGHHPPGASPYLDGDDLVTLPEHHQSRSSGTSIWGW
jgi:hypothetical protein